MEFALSWERKREGTECLVDASIFDSFAKEDIITVISEVSFLFVSTEWFLTVVGTPLYVHIFLTLSH